MKNVPFLELVGMIAKYIFIAALVLGGIYVVFWMANPVFEKVGETIGNVSRALHIGSGDDFHSLAVLAMVGILIVGIVKVLSRRK